jgi:hypothetical protein
MPHRRQVQKGSFGAHLDEVVKHFPDQPDGETGEPPQRSAALQ